MLKIVIPGKEYTKTLPNGDIGFVYDSDTEVTLEHSLISISKWESIWHKPFLDEHREKTREEIISYVKCMSLKEVPDKVYENISNSNYADIMAYIEDTMTATWFAKENSPPPSTKIITSEVIYSWMIQNDIPFDPCQKWHLSRLLTLIRVCSEANMPAKKMSPLETMTQNIMLNKARRAALHSSG